MKKVITAAAILMMLGAGTVFAAEPRGVVIDETTTTCNIYSSQTGAKVGNFDHYSTYGVPNGGSGYRVITNTTFNLSPAHSVTTETKLENNNQTAYAKGTFNNAFSAVDRHKY